MNAFSWTCSIQHNVLKSVLFIGMFVRNSLVKELPASGVNGVPVLLEDMPEGTYSFEIVTKDLYGNESLVVEASGKSYGNSYKSGLINARYSSITQIR